MNILLSMLIMAGLFFNCYNAQSMFKKGKFILSYIRVYIKFIFSRSHDQFLYLSVESINTTDANLPVENPVLWFFWPLYCKCISIYPKLPRPFKKSFLHFHNWYKNINRGSYQRKLSYLLLPYSFLPAAKRHGQGKL